MTDPLYERLGEALRAARAARGLTQEETADRAGLKRTTLTNIERGQQSVAVHQLLHLCASIGVDPALVVGELAGGAGGAAEGVGVDRPDLRAWVVSLTSRPRVGAGATR